MKKLLLVIAIVFSMGMSSFAQTDGFINDWETSDDWRYDVLLAIAVPHLNDINDTPAPLGEGLLIMCTLGAGYAISRRKRNK